jgi:hypothetical protein
LRKERTIPSLDDPKGASPDIDPDADPEGDPGEELEAMIERADHAFGSESFGTTAEEQEEGESLDQKLAEEWPSPMTVETELAIEDADEPDREPEMIGEASIEHDPFVAPEEAAMGVRDKAPGGVDHLDDEYVELYDASIDQDE